ncbi:hypothetical protein YC2023_009758 [Brassica napus]
MMVVNSNDAVMFEDEMLKHFIENQTEVFGSEALAPRLPLRVLNLCDTSATPLCLWVPHLHKLFASKRFCSSSSSPELCLHRLYALPSDLRLRSMPLLNLRTGGVFLGEPVMEIYPEADTQN